LVFALFLQTFAQSGRRQEPAKISQGRPPGPGPIADPNRPGGSIKAQKGSDEIEANDVVRISSNLVPIPVSAVDAKGNAVINLKLEDLNCALTDNLNH
jgi:hypothetical protein